MKPVSAYFGSPQERAEEHRAWWWKRTGSGHLLWPGEKYILVKRFFDDMGRPPIKNLSWDRIYTPEEYTMYLLTVDSKKKILTTGSQFTGQIHQDTIGQAKNLNK